MKLTKKDKNDMLRFIGFEVDEEDWISIKEMIEQVKTDKPKYENLFWSDKNKCAYIIRSNKINILRLIYSHRMSKLTNESEKLLRSYRNISKALSLSPNSKEYIEFKKLMSEDEMMVLRQLKKEISLQNHLANKTNGTISANRGRKKTIQTDAPATELTTANAQATELTTANAPLLELTTTNATNDSPATNATNDSPATVDQP